MGKTKSDEFITVRQSMEGIIKGVKKLAFFWDVAMSRNPEIEKHMTIYRRTKKKRIKKKQLSKVKKLL